MLTKIEVFEYFGPKLKFLENYNRYQDFNFFYQNRDVPKNIPRTYFFRKFFGKSRFSTILTKIEIFQNFLPKWRFFRKL